MTVPADLARALGAKPEAKRFFDGLSYSKQQWFVLSVEGAKTAETRRLSVKRVVFGDARGAFESELVSRS